MVVSLRGLFPHILVIIILFFFLLIIRSVLPIILIIFFKKMGSSAEGDVFCEAEKGPGMCR